ncbi:MAG: hypothetical protein RL172_1819 [Bacteroidota bacterium]|jgi:uncharacterized damage-inducible protein DinB
MKHHFIKQFEFEHWSNGTILTALRSINEPDAKALRLFSHLLSSHSMWLSRVNYTGFTCTLFQERTLDECQQLMNENLAGWKIYLADKTNEQLAQSIEFLPAWQTNPVKSIIRIDDAIVHLINHSSYHRGQIISRIKGAVAELPLSTYIIYASQQL